ncbi:MAG: serine hydrolase [Bacteroidota bacterium]
MKKLVVLLLSLGLFIAAKSQNYYFPPVMGSQWDTVSPASLNWCTSRLDTVYKYLDFKDSKAFIILKGGKIAVEKYFDDFTQDSIWYWASAGKTLTTFLVGMAQQDGKLSINDTTSKFLGKGWTSCTPQQENKITLWHHLTMTTGLDDAIAPTPQVPDPDNCMEPACLQYKADAGTRWAYHNAPYRILHEILDSATGYTINQYTVLKLRNTTGIQGLWYDGVFYSRPREMARFGSLMLNKGKWGNTTVLPDTNYLKAATNTSQSINPSYGYLWWLNGKSTYKIPDLQVTFNGPLVPNAPADMVAGLGKNDQKLYVIPSMDMVIIRMGNDSGQPVAAVSSFDNELWGLLKDVFCPNGPVSVDEPRGKSEVKIYPNPANNVLYIEGEGQLLITDMNGRIVLQSQVSGINEFSIQHLTTGVYTLRFINAQGTQNQKLIKE